MKGTASRRWSNGSKRSSGWLIASGIAISIMLTLSAAPSSTEQDWDHPLLWEDWSGKHGRPLFADNFESSDFDRWSNCVSGNVNRSDDDSDSDSDSDSDGDDDDRGCDG